MNQDNNKPSFWIGLGVAAIGVLLYFFIQSTENSDIIVNAPDVIVEAVGVDETDAIVESEPVISKDVDASTVPIGDKVTSNDRLEDDKAGNATSTVEDATEAPIEAAETTEIDSADAVSQPSVTTEEQVVDTEDSAIETAASDPVDEVKSPATEASEESVEAAVDRTTTVTAEPEIVLEGDAPEFDLVRVDDTGTAVIAGTAEPNTLVTILSDGEKIGEAIASSSGEFVAIVQTPDKEIGQAIELTSKVNGQPLFSSESIFILPTLSSTAAESAATETAPSIIRASDEGVVIVQSAGLLLLDQISLDSISYDEDGEVILAGRGSPGNGVIVYVDGAAIKETIISESGSWKTVLQDLRAGRYVLRVDEIDSEGEVNSRAESPFQRAFPQEVREAQQSGQGTYIVQPGNSLWIIATGKYGEGLKYHQILAANKDQIRDPDLIYPGQVFDLPETTE